jgi:hypothetical protein
MQTQQVVFFKEMREQRSRHQVLGKIWWERLYKLLPWRGCANAIISQSRVHAWSPTFYLFNYSNFNQCEVIPLCGFDLDFPVN